MVLPLVLLCGFLQEALPDDSLFRSSSAQVLVTHLLTSTCTFLFQHVSFHYVAGHQFVQHCSCKELMHIILDYFPISQSNHYNIMLPSICTNQYCISPSALLGLEFQVLIYIYIDIYISRTHFCSPFNTLHSLLVIFIQHTNTHFYAPLSQVYQIVKLIHSN